MKITNEIKFILITIISLIMLSACSNATSGDSSKSKESTDTLKVGFIIAAKTEPTGPIGWANHTGLLKEQLDEIGIENIEFKGFYTTAEFNDALNAGAIDIGTSSDLTHIIGKSAGLKSKLVNIDFTGLNVWLLTKESGPNNIEELKGKKIGVAYGGYMHRYLLEILKEHNILDDVEIVNLVDKDAEAPLANGEIAAQASAVIFGPQLLKKGGFKAIDQADDHPGWGGQRATIISEEYLALKPELPEVWNSITKEALQDMKENKDEYYQYQAEVTGYDLDVLKASYPVERFTDSVFTKETLDQLETTKDFLLEQGLIKKDFDVQEWLIKNEK